MLRAPAGSTTMASSLYNFKIVVQTFPSGTRTMSSNECWQISNGLSPTRFTAAPSTNLSMSVSIVFLPFSNDVFIEAAPCGSTPISLVSGLNCLKTEITPAAKPPPPIGKNKKSILFLVSSITSNPKVPCPAITHSSSNGCTKTALFSLLKSIASL